MIPLEWLNELVQTRDGYRRLLAKEGNLLVAAHRIAVAKCMSWEVATHVPTRREVRVAAQMIARQVPGLRVPETAAIVRECEALGLAVL